MEVSSEAWAYRMGQRADPRDHGYEAGRDGHAGASMCFEPTVHYGFSTRNDGDRADSGPLVHPLAPLDHTSTAGTICIPVGAAKLALLSIPSMSSMTTGIPGPKVIRAAEYNRYSEVAESTVPYDRAGVSRCAVWGSEAGTVKQRVSGKHFEPAAHNSSHARFVMASVADSTHAHTRQTASAWVDVGSAELYSSAGISSTGFWHRQGKASSLPWAASPIRTGRR